jgi:hypothetical protein
MPKPSSVRNTPVVVPVLLGLLGVVLIVVAVVYFTKTASGLPSFFPGHEGSKNGIHHHHTKHGILALVLGILALIGAWITAGRSSTS